MKLKITRLLIVPVLLSLSGCLWQKIDNVEIEKAQALCSLYDSKLYYMTESMFGKTVAKCENGARINLDFNVNKGE